MYQTFKLIADFREIPVRNVTVLGDNVGAKEETSNPKTYDLNF